VVLARTVGHEATLSTVASCVDRFWALQRIADPVRQPAGFGSEHLPDGAPPLAQVYRNWRKAMEEMDGLRATHRSLRLWRTVVDGWGPGVWIAKEISAPTKDENSFGARLARFGSAVGVNWQMGP
jgi:hypothetical protein